MKGGAPAGPYHVKNAAWIQTTAGMKCGTNYYNGGVNPDPYDPEFPTAYNGLFAAAIPSPQTGMLFFQPDDGDNLFMMNQVSSDNSHPDGGLMVASMAPVVTTSSPAAGGAFSYTNKTYFAKLGLSAWLQAQYGTIAALNTAWHTSYTTFGTSDAGGLTGIANGTYSSYGTGTGFLDENGNNLVSSGQSCSGLSGNGPQQNESWGAYSAIQTDIDHWLAFGFGAQWASQVWSAYHVACASSCAPMSIPVYGGPVIPSASNIYAGMASVLSGDSVFFWVAPGSSTNTSLISFLQNIINSDIGFPVVLGNYFETQADSYIQASACPGGTIQCIEPQSARGLNWVSAEQDALSLTNPSGKYSVVGFEHWSMFDSYSQTGGFGIFTANDNAYDGSASSTASSSGACATNHAYTTPSVCLDTNGNLESLAVPSCTSATSGTVWKAKFGLLTTDKTCVWFNDGTYTRIVEAGNFGNVLLLFSLVNFNLANFPSSTALFVPTPLSFPNQVVTTSSAPNAVTLTNMNTKPLTISSVAIAGTNFTDFGQTNTCGSTLAVNASCTINVIFSPSVVAPRSGVLTVTDIPDNVNGSVPLSGTGINSVPPPFPHRPVIMGNFPSGTIGLPYSSGLTASSATPPLTWSVAPSPPLSGLSMSTSSGLITGTPLGGQNTNFDV